MGILIATEDRQGVTETITVSEIERAKSYRFNLALVCTMIMYLSTRVVGMILKLDHFSEGDLSHRIWLSVAAFCLDLDEVADMADWPIENIRKLLQN